jgi:hypothetical protein
MHRVLLAALLCTFALACATPRPPDLAHVAHSRFGEVRAESQRVAERMAEVLDDVAPHVALLMHVASPPPVDVRIVARLAYSQLQAVCIRMPDRTWIEIPASVVGADAEEALAHELVHAWLDARHQELPGVVVEGLASYVAGIVQPQVGAKTRLAVLLAVSKLAEEKSTFVRPGLKAAFMGDPMPLSVVGSTSLVFYPPFDRDSVPPPRTAVSMDIPLESRAIRSGSLMPLYSIGYAVVWRIGLDRLEELCTSAREQGRTRVSAQAFLAAAGLDGESYTGWRERLDGLFDNHDVPTILDSIRVKRAEVARQP